MQIYHVETQEDYDALMVELDGRGVKWISGQEATDLEEWHNYKECTGIFLENNIIEYGDIDIFKEDYPDIPIIKYKAKSPGTKMQEGVSKLARAMKQNDPVNNPSHYTQGELEVIDILQDKLTPQEFEGFLKGNILKYTFREGIKNGTEDMKKGAWYMSRLIDFRKKQEG